MCSVPVAIVMRSVRCALWLVGLIGLVLGLDRLPSQSAIICKPGQSGQQCDTRVPIEKRDYPWSAIGRLQIGESKFCTGTLVRDRWVLTNAHCVVNRSTHALATDVIFAPNLIDGALRSHDDQAKVIEIIVGTDFRDSQTVPHREDWALLQLDRDLGTKYGTLAWRALPLQLLTQYRQRLVTVGYAQDFPDPKRYPQFTAGVSYTMGLNSHCSVTGETENRSLIHNCDSRPGSSGSPILGWFNGVPQIVAVNSAESTIGDEGFGDENYAVNVNFLDTWYSDRQNQQRLNSGQPSNASK
jgi:protease YdgD